MSTATQTPAPTAGKKTADDVQALIRARNSLLWIVTREEVRVERALAEAAAGANYEIRFWDCGGGVVDAAGEEKAPGSGAKQPGQALKAIAEQKARAVPPPPEMRNWQPPKRPAS